jgi:hypothetical protein
MIADNLIYLFAIPITALIVWGIWMWKQFTGEGGEGEQ